MGVLGLRKRSSVLVLFLRSFDTVKIIIAVGVSMAGSIHIPLTIHVSEDLTFGMNIKVGHSQHNCHHCVLSLPWPLRRLQIIYFDYPHHVHPNPSSLTFWEVAGLLNLRVQSCFLSMAPFNKEPTGEAMAKVDVEERRCQGKG